MRAEELRKLYTYNTFHAALAYLGARQGIGKVVDCLADPQVRADAVSALSEASAALQAACGFSADAMAQWNSGVLAQTSNPLLGDTVERYGADPRRKLARADRLVGPLLLAHQHNLPFNYLARAVAAGLLYANPSDAGAGEIRAMIHSQGLRTAILKFCMLTPAESDVADAIARAYLAQLTPEEWAGLAEQARTLGFAYEQTYHGCGQCVFAAISDTLGIFNHRVFEAATGLSGGLGLAGDSACGALMGATLVFGMLSPRRRDQFGGDRQNKYRTFDMVQKLRQKYLDTYGSITCHEIHRQLLGRPYDLRDSNERKAFEAAGAHDDKCTNVVARAAQWAVEIIGEQALD